jgi:hypothetical protein
MAPPIIVVGVWRRRGAHWFRPGGENYEAAAVRSPTTAGVQSSSRRNRSVYRCSAGPRVAGRHDDRDASGAAMDTDGRDTGRRGRGGDVDGG